MVAAIAERDDSALITGSTRTLIYPRFGMLVKPVGSDVILKFNLSIFKDVTCSNTSCRIATNSFLQLRYFILISFILILL